MNFSIRKGNLELRSCGDKLSTNDGEHYRAEIIKWGKQENDREFCCTVALWYKDSDGYDLKFVGSRPFDTDMVLFMELAKQGQQLLECVINEK